MFPSTSVISLYLGSYRVNHLKVALQVEITCTKSKYINFSSLYCC